MKIIKTNEGNVALVFNNDEIVSLLTCIDNDTFQLKSPEPNWKQGFHKNTIAFLQDLKMSIGTSTVKRNDPRVKALIRKYYITALVDVLRKLQGRGFAEYTKKGDSRGSSIISFRLMY